MSSSDDILQCDCGCIVFTISRDGLIECGRCRAPTAGLIATPEDVPAYIEAKGINIRKDRLAKH
ncbi:MAG: hypothetical protein ABL893_04615 [Hyphomicrobium sp.]